MIALTGARCTLRELAPSDAASIQRHGDDQAVARNMFDGFPSPYTLEQAEAWCGGVWRGLGHVFAIAVDGEAIGCIGVRPDDGWLRCNAEIGYWLGSAHWGRGIATEALGLATAWAWGALPELTRLYASIFAWNEGSKAVARKCGYVEEGRMPRSAIKDGRVIDRELFAAYRT